MITDILPATSTLATSTYPYSSEGPVNFQDYNFVRTTQKDYYYSASGTLVSTVEQTYDPGLAVLYVGLITFSFVALTLFIIKQVMKY